MRHNIEDELQISEFIKDPASLKLLILAGTSIRSNELSTINKCISLIKLDLSSNQLAQLPLKCQNFPNLRILYLHDNKLSSVNIVKTNIEYISLFDNVIKNYRTNLIQSNEKLLAIDYNIVTKSQKLFHTTPQPYSLLKWPIVEISQSLEHEEDYLNLLKAELFVINQVYRKTKYSDVLNKYFSSFNQFLNFKALRNTATIQNFFHKESMKEVAIHWINFTQKKKKLKRLFENTPKSYLLLNKVERANYSRSPGVTKVMNRFVQSIRERMIARKILAKSISFYRLFIPTRQIISQKFMDGQKKIYLKESQIFYFQKMILYAKKIFFNRKEYDLLDNFQKMMHRTNKSYYIIRSQKKNRSTFLMEMVANSMGLVIIQKNIDRRSILYNRKGHKSIQIKRVIKTKQKLDREKLKILDEKVERMYKNYDTLVEYVFLNDEIFQKMMAIIRYFNAGNHKTIIQNQAAYFQTEVIFQDKNEIKEKPKLFFCSYDQMKRVLSANILQKWWRKVRSVKKLKRNILMQIKMVRATKLINKWLRDLTFRHRLQFNKLQSCIKSTFRQIELYIELQIYMNLPQPKDTLKLRPKILKLRPKMPSQLSNQYLYNLIHNKTQIEILQYHGKSWIKIRYLSSSQAYEAQKQLSIYTYKYYFNGKFIRMFTQFQINYQKELQSYENQIAQLFKIKMNPITNSSSALSKIAKKIDIQNTQPFFIWPLVQEGFASMFKIEDIQSMSMSIFIYNKNRRPLKVNCDLLWVTPLTIYHYRKRIKPQIKIRTPIKQKPQIQSGMEHYMPHIRHKLNRERQFSVKQHKSLLQANRQRGISHYAQLNLLSETLNIKKQ